MKHILQRITDSEIDWGINSSWDAGFLWWCGDDMLKRSDVAVSFDAAIEAMRQAAIELYPNSDFAIAESQN